MSYHFPLPPSVAAAHAKERGRLAALRAVISREIEADLARVDRCLAARRPSYADQSQGATA